MHKASCEDISTSSKKKNMGVGATIIYFGNRLGSGLNGDPQNVGPSLNLYTCEWDFIWKTVFAGVCSPPHLSPGLLSPAYCESSANHHQTLGNL